MVEYFSNSDEDNNSHLSNMSERNKTYLKSAGIDSKEVKSLCIDEKNIIWRYNKALLFT